jgi:hypothetical protein
MNVVRGAAGCDAVRGASFCVEIGRVEIGARHARPDKQRRPGTLRPDQALLLSMIAGMAHSTLESGAATQNGVAFGVSAEGPVNATRPKDHSPVIVKSCSGCGQLRSRSAANGSMGRIRKRYGRACPDATEPSSSNLQRVLSKRRRQAWQDTTAMSGPSAAHRLAGNIWPFGCVYSVTIAIPADFFRDPLTTQPLLGYKIARAGRIRRPSRGPRIFARTG